MIDDEWGMSRAEVGEKSERGQEDGVCCPSAESISSSEGRRGEQTHLCPPTCAQSVTFHLALSPAVLFPDAASRRFSWFRNAIAKSPPMSAHRQSLAPCVHTRISVYPSGFGTACPVARECTVCVNAEEVRVDWVKDG